MPPRSDFAAQIQALPDGSHGGAWQGFSRAAMIFAARPGAAMPMHIPTHRWCAGCSYQTQPARLFLQPVVPNLMR
jgi:hypothetical protein